MNNKSITYLASALLLMGAATSCEHSEIQEKLEFSARLSSSNTYLVGQPVVFEFDGNADYLSIWSGDRNHEYRYRNRTTVAVSEIEQCQLTFGISRRSGANTGDVQVYVANKGVGLTGDNVATDKATVEGIAAENFSQWIPLDIEEAAKSGAWANTTHNLLDIDGKGTSLVDNFGLLIRWHPSVIAEQRNYYINTSVLVKFRDREPSEMTYSDLGYKNFNMAPEMVGEEYKSFVTGKKIGLMQYGQAAGNIILNGLESGAFCPYLIDTWILSTPTALNRIAPDTGWNIKGVTDDLTRFQYTYTEPGTYTVTVVASTGSYQGQSRDTRELTFTIIDPIK